MLFYSCLFFRLVQFFGEGGIAHTDLLSGTARYMAYLCLPVFLPLIDAVVEEHILLMDDIYTTGATLRKAASALKEAGAARVFSITVAR